MCRSWACFFMVAICTPMAARTLMEAGELPFEIEDLPLARKKICLRNGARPVTSLAPLMLALRTYDKKTAFGRGVE
jgi:hypothetical protein